DMHGAGAAHPYAATELCAGEADHVADDPQQRSVLLDVDGDGAPVDREFDHARELRMKIFIATRQKAGEARRSSRRGPATAAKSCGCVANRRQYERYPHRSAHSRIPA